MSLFKIHSGQLYNDIVDLYDYIHLDGLNSQSRDKLSICLPAMGQLHPMFLDQCVSSFFYAKILREKILERYLLLEALGRLSFWVHISDHSTWRKQLHPVHAVCFYIFGSYFCLKNVFPDYIFRGLYSTNLATAFYTSHFQRKPQNRFDKTSSAEIHLQFLIYPS